MSTPPPPTQVLAVSDPMTQGIETHGARQVTDASFQDTAHFPTVVRVPVRQSLSLQFLEKKKGLEKCSTRRCLPP